MYLFLKQLSCVRKQEMEKKRTSTDENQAGSKRARVDEAGGSDNSMSDDDGVSNCSQRPDFTSQAQLVRIWCFVSVLEGTIVKIVWNFPLPPRKVRKHFLTRYTVKNGISNLYILLKSALKMQELPFQRPKFQKISGVVCPRTPLQLCRHYGLPLTKILATPLFIIDIYIYSTKKIVCVAHVQPDLVLLRDASWNLFSINSRNYKLTKRNCDNNWANINIFHL